MSLLLLVRHGQASWGSDDYDRLSSRGEEQSRLLGAALAGRGVHPDLVLRGSMVRHRQTAEAAVSGAGWQTTVEEDDGWDEFDHLGTLDGSAPFEHVDGEPDEDRVRRFNGSIARWASGEHDGEYVESFPAFRARVRTAFDVALHRLGPRETAVVFTSGGPVSWVAATLTDGGLPAWSRLSRVVVNASVTKVLTGRGGTNLITFNDHGHLEGGVGDLLTYR